MTGPRLGLAALAGLAVLLLVGCDDTPGVGAKNFQKQYAIAREALEEGRYARATEAYAALIPRAGPLAPRLRLEFAHTHLRAGRFAEASKEAEALAGSQSGAARAAALAVHGTAQHELGRAALDAGDRTAGKRHLQAASSALGDMLKTHPELDPVGSMAGRHSSIKSQLNAL